MTALLAAVAFTLSACSGDQVETKPEADVNAAVQKHANAIAAVAGQALQNPKVRAGGCTDPNENVSDSVYTVQGVYTLPAPAAGEKHLDVIAKVRDDWKAKGYTITDDRTVAADRGVAAARTPDGYKLDIETGDPRGFAVFVDSPCYARP
ncbi:hypothetical protein [Actinoplanes sp. SE50]|uniref:hypothetical protein n=1 Tax=Actinoplanes sp. SE50 TaxID=2033844 RepID=UPI001E407346|nr:hypothetical protein [Actinoplanes sp. SE50]